MQKIKTLSNGLVVIVEEMPHFESVAYDLFIPGGIVLDADDRIGSSLILSELTTRGAGDLDSHALSEAFDEYGIRHGEAAGGDRHLYRGSLLADNLDRAVELVAMMVLSPTLPQDEIEDIRSVYLQDIAGIADSPSQRAMLSFSDKYYPKPHSRPGIGTEEGLKATTLEDLQKMWRDRFMPEGSVMSFAGKVNAEKVFQIVEKHFEKWQGKAKEIPLCNNFPQHTSHHIHSDSAQLQIILGYPSAKFNDKHYYTAKLANQVLSGGMFGRLFIEVREKRGLCYSVYSRHAATNEYGICLAYAGTTPERAHETLQVMLKEMRSLKGTVSEDELKRTKANLKSALIIGEESSGSRASSNASDWWLNKRLRTLDEIEKQIDKVSIGDIDEYVDQFPANSFTLVTLGSRDLTSQYTETKI